MPTLGRWGLLALTALLTIVSTTSRAKDEFGHDGGKGLSTGEPAKPKKLTAKDVIESWSPLLLKTAQDYGQMGAVPEQSPNVAAYSFRVMGPTFEELWNHYAQLCGMKQRYEEKTFLIRGDTGPNGSYVVSDRMPAPGKIDRGLSVFLLRTDSYTVTATFQADADGKSITGSLTAVTPP